MRYITDALYKKMQLFHLPVDGDMTLADVEELFGIEAEDFLLQELLARDDWYDTYLPEPLHSRLFDSNGEVSLRDLDDSLWQEILQYRQSIEQEWAQAAAQAQEEKRKLMTAAPELGALVQLDLRDSEIRSISGIDSDEIQIKLYPQWDLGKILILRFTDVKDSWMSRMHPDDANWWLADEIALDEERPGRYTLQALFGNADFVGQLQFSFAGVTIKEREDPLEY